MSPYVSDTSTRPPAPVVALCMPLRDPHLSLRCHQSYCGLDTVGITWHHITVDSRQVDEARNELAKIALSIPEVTHLLWIDDDMVYPGHALKKLLAHDLPIVGGLCHDRRHPYKPVIARYFDKSWGCEEGTYGWLFDYPENQVIEVDATGGAFLLVKREVFERIASYRAKGWADWWTPIPARHGQAEDLAFMWRAQSSGYKIHVDTGLDIGHVAEVVVDAAFARHNRAFEYSRWHPPLSTLADAVRSRRADDPIARELADPRKKYVASIVITAYNPKAEYLRAAVLSALAQTVPCEVIVVDDGSEWGEKDMDDPLSPVRRAILDLFDTHPNLSIIVHPMNRGISAALNTGIAAMQSDWFCWLPCDDTFEPMKVEMQLSYLLSVGGLAGYHGYNHKLDNRNQVGHVPIPLWTNAEDQNRLLARGCVINGTTVMIHRSVLEEAKRGIGSSLGCYFDPTLKYAQDWDLWVRIGRQFRWWGMPDKLATRREFGNLTERLRKSEDPRKLEEDEIVRARAKGAIDPRAPDYGGHEEAKRLGAQCSCKWDPGIGVTFDPNCPYHGR